RSAASTPSDTPQNTRCRTGPASPSPVHSMSTTREAESEDVAKKMATMTIANPWTSVVAGKFSKNSNIARGMLSATAAEMAPPSPPIPSISSADQPKTENQMSVNADGAKRTARMNSRIVRPLEMRATKIPMNGDQVTVQAQ